MATKNHPEPNQVTVENGKKIQKLIQESTTTLSLEILGNKLGITGERVRQICIQMKIDRPKRTRGRIPVRIDKPCPTCGENLPFKKHSPKHVIRCPICDPTHVTAYCRWCEKSFVLLASHYKARKRTHKGYKGNLYCSKQCHNTHRASTEWWKKSPIYQRMQTGEKIDVKQAIEEYQMQQSAKKLGVKDGKGV